MELRIIGGESRSQRQAPFRPSSYSVSAVTTISTFVIEARLKMAEVLRGMPAALSDAPSPGSKRACLRARWPRLRRESRLWQSHPHRSGQSVPGAPLRSPLWSERRVVAGRRRQRRGNGRNHVDHPCNVGRKRIFIAEEDRSPRMSSEGQRRSNVNGSRHSDVGIW